VRQGCPDFTKHAGIPDVIADGETGLLVSSEHDGWNVLKNDNNIRKQNSSHSVRKMEKKE
jgi:hypothetical protein